MLIPKLNMVFIYTCNGKYSREDIKRFLKFIKVNKEIGCWEWQGHLMKQNYGTFKYKNKSNLAHRVAYELFYNKLIPEGMCVCHHCDNPKCCNPFHLFLGTNSDNSNDKVIKNRQSHLPGELNGRSKFTWEIINKIRKLYNYTENTPKQLMKIFSISDTTLWHIIKNTTWYNPYYMPFKFNRKVRLLFNIAGDCRDSL